METQKISLSNLRIDVWALRTSRNLKQPRHRRGIAPQEPQRQLGGQGRRQGAQFGGLTRPGVTGLKFDF